MPHPTPRARRTRPHGPAPKTPRSWLGLETLEAREVPSAYYDLTTVAATTDGFVHFGDLPSINDAGTVAFVGFRDLNSDGHRESGLWTRAVGGSLANVNPGFSDTEDRDFGRAVAVNNAGVLTARDQLGTHFDLRTWSGGPDSNTILASTSPGFATWGKYSSLQTFTAVNDAGDVAFVGTNGDFRTLEVHRHTQPAEQSTQLDTFPAGSAGGPTPRPQLTADGRVLARLTNGTVTLFGADGTQRVFASGKDGFTSTGAAPGVTEDGRVVVFAGDRGRGPGVFAAYYSGGTRRVVRVAGEGLDGWTGFDPNSAVRVGGSLTRDRGLTVAFEGTNAALGHGIFTARLSFFGLAGDSFDPDRVSDVRVSGASPVALVGDRLGVTSGPTITDLELFGMNDRGRGDLAFWVQTGAQEAIVRATPRQVVNLDFFPTLFPAAASTAANLALLQDTGLSAGWTGSFAQAMTSVGYAGNTAALAAQVIDDVQALYAATGATVAVRSQPVTPDYVPRTLTTEDGRVVNAPGGAPVRDGVAQTVQIGKAPTPTGELLGLAAPVYSRAGGLDFFNQVADDLAVVFPDRIMLSPGFTKPLAQRTDAELARAVADVIAHEAGHNFGLVHTRSDLADDLMHAATNAGEFDGPQAFALAPEFIDTALGVPSGTEAAGPRLVFAAGGPRGAQADPPSQPLLDKQAQFSATTRYKLAGSLTAGATVSHLLVGTVNPFGGDLLPEFRDLGGGNLADLLAGSPVEAGTGASLVLVGSTDGTAADIVGVPAGQAGAETSLTLTGLGVMTDPRLRAAVGASGASFNLFRMTAGGPVAIGTATVTGVAAAGVSDGGTALTSGGTLGLGTADVGGAALTRTLTVRNTGTADLHLGTASVAGTGYGLTPPAATTLAPGAQTTLAVTLSAATAGVGITGTLTIPSDDPAGAFTLTLRGTVDGRPRVIGVTRLDNGTGPLRVAIDFSAALAAGPAGDPKNFSITSDTADGGVAVVSAAYSATAGGSRVTLTGPDAAALPAGTYRVRVAGDKVKAASGELLTDGASDLLVDVRQTASGVVVGPTADGSLGVVSGPSRWAAGGGADSIAVADFNGDGRPDIAAAGSDTFASRSSYDISLLPGGDDGGYDPVVPVTVAGPTTEYIQPLRVLAADWDGNGTPDLVVAESATDTGYNTSTNRVRVLLNDGAGHFTPAPDTPIPLTEVGGNWAATLTVGDFTGDGKNDLATDGRTAAGDLTVVVFSKDRFLGYTPAFHLPIGHNNNWEASQIQAGDLNGDGKPDLVVGTTGYYLADPDVVYFLSGPAGYGAAQDLVYDRVSSGPFQLADLDADGKLDIALVHDDYRNSADVHDGSVLSVLAGDGTGRFTEVTHAALNRRGVTLVAAADTDADGKVDLVFRDDAFTQAGYDPTPEASLQVARNLGGHQFRPGPLAPVAPTGVTSPGNYVVADLNRDGKPDLAFGNTTGGQIGLAVNDGAGGLRASAAGPNLGTPNGNPSREEPAFVGGDINRDGFPDYLRNTGAGIDVYLGTPGGGFRLARTLPISTYYLRLGDLNNDGLLDLVAQGPGQAAGVPAVYLGDGAGGFTLSAAPAPAVPSGYGFYTGTLADVNGDGDLDLVATLSTSRVDNSGVTHTDPAAFGVFFGDGTGRLIGNANTVYQPGGYGLYAYTPPPSVFDVTGDGIPDLLTGTNDNSTSLLTVNRGNGNGTFTPAGTVARDQLDYTVQFVPGDFDRDGKLDLLGYDANYATVRYYRGTGPGQFAADSSRDIPLELFAGQVSVADFTGDGIADVAYTRGSFLDENIRDYFVVLPGDGSGHFGPGQQIPVGGELPLALLPIPRGGTFDAGSFAVNPPVLSAPAGTGNLSATTRQDRSVGIDARAPFLPFAHSPLVLAVSAGPTHGRVVIDPNGTPADQTDDLLRYVPDATYAGADSFTYLVGDGRGGTATGTVSLTVTGRPMVSFASAAYSVDTTASSDVTITLTRTGDTTAAGTVTVNTLGGTAAAGIDYVAGPYQATFAAGQTTATVTVPVYNDPDVASNTVGLSLSAAGELTAGSPSAATLTLVHAGAPPNTPPTISDVTDRTVAFGASTGAVSFTVGDAETPAAGLVVTSTTSDPVLFPSVVLGGSGANRTVTVTPAAGLSGSATVTLTVRDAAGATASDTFTVTVNPPAGNTPPTITGVADITIPFGGTTGPQPFTVGDAETPAGSLAVTVSASDPSLFSSLAVGGSGASRTVTAAAAAGRSGSATVTLLVTDAGGARASDSFVVTVLPVSPPPPPPPARGPSREFGVGSGTGSVARFFNPDGTERFAVDAFPGFAGGVRAAAADFDGDGVADLAVGTGPGGPSLVRVLAGTDGHELFSFAPFEPAFLGGVFVAAGDITGDGKADLVVSPDEGGGPRVTVLRGGDFSQVANYFAIDDPNFRGGARAGVGDMNGDGFAEVVVSAGFQGGPRVSTYDGKSVAAGTPRNLFGDFFIFEPELRNGAYVAVGDVDGDGLADIVGGAGPGGGPRVRVLSGRDALTPGVGPAGARELGNFFGGDAGNRGGIRVTTKDLDGDAKADIVVGDAAGTRVTAYRGKDFAGGGAPEALAFDAFPGVTGGVFVG